MNDSIDFSGERVEGTDFIREIIAVDLASEKHSDIVTRFPPEPNGYLHIGHAKAICLNFGVALEGENRRCHLRFDDTNPETEDMEFVRSIQEDIRWLGFDWHEHLYFASDYFGLFYECAQFLVSEGQAYVDDLSEEEIREYRGTVTVPGKNSPFRDRPVEESLTLLTEMRAGLHPDGSRVLRAKIDMASPNMLLRDPVLMRIRHAEHYRTGNEWPIYPLYDYAHPLSDAIEGITHSLCSLEFDVHRPLYDWVVEKSWPVISRRRLENELIEDIKPPHQYEFARLNLDYTVMSKRKLLQLVRDHNVTGWDDPRMPTLAGFRKRGLTPSSIRAFCEAVGVAKADNRIDFARLESAVRNDLNPVAPRVLAVSRPLKVELTNYPADKTEWLEAPYFPHDIGKPGSRKVPFSRNVYIEQDDFMEVAEKGFRRLSPGAEVRLKFAYVIRCDEVIKDESGEIILLKCSYDPDTRGGTSQEGRKIGGTLHWVSAETAIPAEFRLYDRLFTVPFPDAPESDFKENLNPDSVSVTRGFVEPSVLDDNPDTRYQFERLGYFWRDPEDGRGENLVFNRIVSLRDTWARTQSKKSGSDDTNDAGSSKDERVIDDTYVRDPLAGKPATMVEKYRLYTEEWDVTDELADILTQNPELAQYFEETAEFTKPGSAAAWVANDVVRVSREAGLDSLLFSPAELGELINMVDKRIISSRIGTQVFELMATKGGTPAELMHMHGLEQVSDEETLVPLVEAMIEAFPDRVQAYRAGKKGLIGFFIGQIMQKTNGKADPHLLRSLLDERLDASE